MILGDAVITRVRAPSAAGPDGLSVPNWKAAEATWSKVDYPGCQFQPLSSTEDVVGQQRTESTHKAFMPAGADVLPTDRLRYRAVDYQVDGQPERWADEGDVDDHVEALCFRIQGG